jgi:hypothetical protein
MPDFRLRKTPGGRAAEAPNSKFQASREAPNKIYALITALERRSPWRVEASERSRPYPSCFLFASNSALRIHNSALRTFRTPHSAFKRLWTLDLEQPSAPLGVPPSGGWPSPRFPTRNPKPKTQNPGIEISEPIAIFVHRPTSADELPQRNTKSFCESSCLFAAIPGKNRFPLTWFNLL